MNATRRNIKDEEREGDEGKEKEEKFEEEEEEEGKEEEKMEDLNLFEPPGIRKKALWQCIRYIAPTSTKKKWKAVEAIGVYCTVCKKKVNYDSSSNPYGIQRHMERFHKQILEEYEVSAVATGKTKKRGTVETKDASIPKKSKVVVIPKVIQSMSEERKVDAAVMKKQLATLQPGLHHPVQRSWTEPNLHASQLIFPLFVTERVRDVPIEGFAPNMQWGKGSDGEYASLMKYLKELQKKGLKSVMLFGVVEAKESHGPMADHPETPVIICTKAIRRHCPDLLVACDVCMCEYTDHGHCGMLVDGQDHDEEPIIDHSRTIHRLAKIAVSYAAAGAHMVSPSDMMDNRIECIRRALNDEGYAQVSIMAYTSKKASCMYAPFRDAVESTFKGDRNRYQHPVGSISHALRAYDRDVVEGADSVIVKPSLFYGDIVHILASKKHVPVVCYVVSGEYKMLMDYGTSTGSLASVVREAHLGLMRAGASVLITYFTPYILENLHKW